MRHVTDAEANRTYVRFMSPLPIHLPIGAMTDETLSILLVAIGLLGLIVTRWFASSESITKRAYGKVYSGAPGANTESKPDSR